MADLINIRTVEELAKFINDKGLIEIAMRGKNNRFKQFQKIAIDSLPKEGEKIAEAMALLNKNINIGEQSLNALNTISKLSSLSVVLSGLNLCATAAGFAIMNAKLDKVSSQIEKVVAVMKETTGIQTDFECGKVISEHSNMLDCRKKQNYYTESQMRDLVAREYNVLNLLLQHFEKNTSDNREELVFSILSLAAMLSVSLKYFDELYYFNNKESITDGDIWHLDHDKWMQVYDRMASNEFIQMIQDFGFFEMGLNTFENDCFYISFIDQIKGLKQSVEDNQTIITAVNNIETYQMFLSQSNAEIKNEIETALGEVGINTDEYQDVIRKAVA